MITPTIVREWIHLLSYNSTVVVVKAEPHPAVREGMWIAVAADDGVYSCRGHAGTRGTALDDPRLVAIVRLGAGVSEARLLPAGATEHVAGQLIDKEIERVGASRATALLWTVLHTPGWVAIHASRCQ